MISADNWFPYVKRRVMVVDRQVEEKSPIEVALLEMESQVAELTEIVNAKVPDIKKLQLRYAYLKDDAISSRGRYNLSPFSCIWDFSNKLENTCLSFYLIGNPFWNHFAIVEY